MVSGVSAGPETGRGWGARWRRWADLLAGRRAQRWLALAAGGAPGLLLGIHLGGLLFFLNPHLPFEAGPVARTVLLYGALGGLASGVLLAVPAWRHPRRSLRFLPWGVTAALAVAALLDSIHASVYAYYLPAGINERLLKAAVWLTLATLVTFYTALLHSLHRRPYGVRSRLAFWLLALASVYLMVERREAFEPRPERARPTGYQASQRPALLVVGIDTATLDALLPMAEEGHLPFFASMLQGGAYGRVTSFEPYRPPVLWTTLATGKYPYEHGVLGARIHAAGFIHPGAELRLLPMGLGFGRWGTFGRPDRPEEAGGVLRVRAVWEVLPRLGVSSGVVGWPAASAEPPADAPAPEFVFPDGFFGEPFDPRGARPETLAEGAWIFRVPLDEVDLQELEGRESELSQGVLGAAAGDAWRQSLARSLIEQRRARAVFLRMPGLARASARFFGGYAELRLEGQKAPEHEAAAAFLGAYYAHLDALLAELWATLPEPRLLAVVSASGVEQPTVWQRVRLALRGERAVGGRLTGAPDGALLLAGEGIRSGTLITGAGLVDAAPTLLYALGLPVARDLDGRVLTEAFTEQFLERNSLTFVPSYETLEPARSPRPPSRPGSGL
ncbi:MAG: alkaline phosphatase family protein [Thermoanaerobaculia bacterium]